MFEWSKSFACVWVRGSSLLHIVAMAMALVARSAMRLIAAVWHGTGSSGKLHLATTARLLWHAGIGTCWCLWALFDQPMKNERAMSDKPMKNERACVEQAVMHP